MSNINRMTIFYTTSGGLTLQGKREVAPDAVQMCYSFHKIEWISGIGAIKVSVTRKEVNP